MLTNLESGRRGPRPPPSVRPINYTAFGRFCQPASVVEIQQNECGISVDSLARVCYNTCMTTRRTPRKDCNYIIYEMVSEHGENYIGLTRKSLPSVTKTVLERWRKHKSRARNENRLWALYIYLKSGGLDLAWEHRVITVIRGRAEAYAYERSLVKELQPTLNDQYCG